MSKLRFNGACHAMLLNKQQIFESFRMNSFELRLKRKTQKNKKWTLYEIVDSDI